MNKIILMGRLTKDPEIRYAQNEKNTAVGRMSIAVDRRFDKEHTDFFNLVAFGKLAEFSEKYLKKGTKVVVEGNLRNNNYTDKNGNKVYAIDVVCESVEFAESKKTDNQEQEQQGDDGFVPIPDAIQEGLPFC